MKDLIKVTEKEGQQLVSGLDLHEFTARETRFDIWIKRMLEYGFTQGVDYQCLYKNVQMPNGGTKKVLEDYALTLDCAKQIAMLQKNDKGMKARQYFIEVEKKYKEISAPQDYISALKALIQKEEEKQRILQESVEKDEQLKKQYPKVLFANSVETSKTSILIGELAKVLRQNDIEIGQKRLFEWLKESGYLMKRGEETNNPTQKSMEMGLMEIKQTAISLPSGEIRTRFTTKITGKGQLYFVNKFLNNKNYSE